MATHVVGTVVDLPPGSVRLVPVGRYGVAVYNVGGQYHALNNYCPHMGAPICLGRVTGIATGDAPGRKGWSMDGEIVECPWHGWKFAIADGRSTTKPVHRIRKYSVEVRDGLVVLEVSDSGEKGSST